MTEWGEGMREYTEASLGWIPSRCFTILFIFWLLSTEPVDCDACLRVFSRTFMGECSRDGEFVSGIMEITSRIAVRGTPPPSARCIRTYPSRSLTSACARWSTDGSREAGCILDWMPLRLPSSTRESWAIYGWAQWVYTEKGGAWG